MLYGRDPERAAIGALLEGARASRSGALVLRGEPGIGKTALLDDARDRATDMHVLTARGVESESELAYAGLDQLLRPSLSLLDKLPAGQAAALGGALGLQPAGSDERFLVFAGCLSLLSEMTERRPVLCIVDDAHWLDRGTSEALVFVARRLHAEGIVLLFGAREGDVRRFEADGVPSLTLTGLDDSAAETLLSRIDGGVAPAVRERLIAHTRGNALALVELPSALSQAQLAGHEPLPSTLPMTDQVESAFLERVRRLPEATQSALLVAAADDVGDAGLVTRAADLVDAGPRALDPAEQAGLVTIRGSRLEFRHPLVRSAVYEAATSSERRAAHRALADALEHDDTYADRRAWHLAASVLKPDDQVVRALDSAAERASQRGGYMAAAKALERAAELSLDPNDRGRRLADAARSARIAAADDYAVALATQAEPLVEDPLLRAEIACAIGAAGVRRGRPLDGFPRLLEAAGEVASLDLPRAVDMLVWANAAAFTVGNIAALGEVSKAAAGLLEVSGNDELTYVVQALGAFAETMAGRTPSPDERDRAFAWAASCDEPELVYLVATALGLMGDDERFGPLIDRAVSLARARGDFGTLVQGLTARGLRYGFLQQRFDASARECEETLQFARELGAVNIASISLCALAYVAAVRGHDDDARRLAADALAIVERNQIRPRIAFAIYALAMLDLGRGQWAAAMERLQNVVNPGSEGNTVFAKWALPDLAEAAARAGRLEEAQEALSAFDEWVVGADLPWARARLLSCRPFLAKGDEATAAFEEALQIDLDDRPFDLARIQLLYGEHLRRERRRTDARAQLRAALEAFERLKAEPWAERARAELRASGETARKRDPSTVDQLTPQEIQIARFVAEGLSNKEVAAQMYLSPRTIDYHLRNVFSKLGITSRTQLARFPLGDEVAVHKVGVAVRA